tara:strand:+ start:980 stop:1330 length:351 start_codon:yes stop_codon:yes gene_type:complete
MIVLKETTDSQTIKFIPRRWVSGNNYNIKIINETTNKEVYNQNSTAITENLYYNQFSAVFSLKEDTYYTITITGVTVTGVVFEGKIYCTNQVDLPEYTINSGQYTEHSTTNEYIII